jgi:hypothetical protein
MHTTDGMRAYGIYRKAVIVVVLLPFLLIGLHCIEASFHKDAYSPPHVSLGDSFLVAGVFHQLDVTVATEQEKICIIAFNGASEPEPQARSENTYYKWEYDNGVWKDSNGYDSSYIDPSQCYIKNTTYSFYIGISHKAKPGSWTFKIIVDNQETSSISFKMTVGSFCLFFSTIIGVFEPMRQQKCLLIKDEGKCCFKQRDMKVSEENIERIVDSVINRQSTDKKEEQSCQNNNNYFCSPSNPVAAQEQLRSAMTIYPRSKLREIPHQSTNTLFFNKTQGAGNGFTIHKSDGMKRFFIIVLIAILLSSSVIPMVVMTGKNLDSGEITIINIQSYPLVGGKWTVLFTTVGQANLTISAVNGTTWSDRDNNHDLRFLRCIQGDEPLMYQWINDSVLIANFSSNTTCYVTSEVLTSGSHTLMFQFGNDVAFAYNLASEHWLQTSTSDFNNGTKNNITVSDGSFHLMERYHLRNFTLIDNEGFEGDWPPIGWSEDPATSNWNKESDRAYEGTFSADFDGGPGGVSGNLLSPSLNCSGSNVTAIYVKFWAYSYRGSANTYFLDYYDGNNWNQITRLDNFGADSWTHYTEKITDSQFFVSNFRIRWRVTGFLPNRNYFVDVVNVTVERNESGYYSAGSLISQAYDTTRNLPDYNNMVVNQTTPPGTTVISWVRTAETQVDLINATWYAGINQVPNNRWVQWRMNLTGDTYLTPTVDEVNLTWTYDDEYPISKVVSFSRFWQITNPFQISATASDNGTGVKEVALYYNYSATNTSGWSGWILYGTNDTTSPYTWSFSPPQGDGYYRFYSRGVDWELNVEDPPGSPGYDAFCGLDTEKPSSQLDTIIPYWYVEPDRSVIINCSNATDSLSGLKNIDLYYRYRMDNESTWGAWRFFRSDDTAPWSWNFNFPKAKGFYQFYSIAVDHAGNSEDPPVSSDNDTECAYDSYKPYSEVDAISPYWHSSPLTITAQGTDFNGSGLSNVTLYYYYSADNSSWSAPFFFAVDHDPWEAISWVFTFPNGTGYYRFYSIAVDNDTNVEYFTDNDTYCAYDAMKPSSQVDPLATYWYNATANPLAITVTNAHDAESGIKNITLWYRYRTSNTSNWNPWTAFDTDENAPWTWDFHFPDGEGRYQFYSIARDWAGNTEDSPISPEYDTECGYETSKPSSQVDAVFPYLISFAPLPLSATASDNAKNVTLWYHFSPENTSWWDDYMYKKQITVTNGDASTLVKNYSINFTFDHASLVSEGKSLENGNDIRIAFYNGTSYIELDRINSTAFNTTTTQLWFKLQNNIDASGVDNNYYLFYNNPSAVDPPQNKSNVYLWFDDFNRANKADITTEAAYRKTNGGTWSIENQKLKNTGAAGDPNKLIVRALGNLTQDVDMFVKINVTFWAGDADTARMGLSCCMDTADGGGYCGLFHQTHSRFEFLNDLRSWGTSASVIWSNNVWYNMRFRVVNPSARNGLGKVWREGTTEPSVWNNTGNFGTGAARTRGQVGLGGSRQADVTYFDDFTVRYVLANEPLCTLDSESLNGWILWDNASNPDTSSPWGWNFDFPEGYGYYRFYSITVDFDGINEDVPSAADAWCKYVQGAAPQINSYDLRNSSRSKLNNATGLLDVNNEYSFIINVTVEYGWVHLDYIDIKTWYDHGNDSSVYNQTLGGNLNMHLRYENTTRNASYLMLWPRDEAQLIGSNCSETIINSTTRVVTISFKPLSQTRWACSNNTWDTTANATNDPFSWNFNITAISKSGLQSWIRDEYGIYKFATILPEKNWVDVQAPPGHLAASNIVNVTYSSNYDFDIRIFFEENLTNVSSGDIIPIMNNVYIRGDADLTDDIINDTVFNGTGEIHAVEIINASGAFRKNNTSQVVRVQFNVYIPFGTIPGEYTARVTTKIKLKE